MADLTSAESTTKFLRSKTESVDDIVDTAHQLLTSQSTVLPNASIFIFDLICDRFNDLNPKSQFSNWKFCEGVWDVLQEVWSRSSPEERESKVRKLRLVEIVTQICSATNDKLNVNEILLTKVINFTKDVFSKGYLEIEENSVLELLQAYMSLINKEKYSESLINPWTLLIIEIFQIPFNRINYKPSKKVNGKFFKDCAGELLQSITSPECKLDSTCHKMIDSVLTRFLKNSQVDQSISSMLDAKANNMISKDSIVHFFSLIIGLQSKDIKVCEESFNTIIKQYPISAELLHQLSKMNRTLSNDFIKQIYDKEVINKRNIDWNLVGYLIMLDSEVAIAYDLQIFKLVSGTSHAISIGMKLVESYSRIRELPRFITDVWISLVEINPVWNSAEFIAKVSQIINTLSAVQVVNIMTELKLKQSTNQDISPMLSSIVQGLLHCSQSKINAVQQSLLDHELYSKLSSQTENYWQIQYYLFTVYGRKVLDAQLFENSQPPNLSNKMYIWTQLRKAELGFGDGGNINVAKFLSSNPNLIIPFLKRWIILYDNYKDINTIFQSLFAHVAPDEILQYINQHAIVIFECKSTKLFIQNLIAQLKSKNYEYMPLILQIPIQVIGNKHKIEMLDICFSIAIDDSVGTEINELSRKCIAHILVQPSFTSCIETKFPSILELVAKDMGSKEISLEIFKQIWHSNCKQANTTYINETLSYLTKTLYRNSSSISYEFHIASIIIQHSSDEKFEELKSIFTQAAINILKKCCKDVVHNKQDIKWLLVALCNTNTIKSQPVISVVNDIGTSISSSKLQQNKSLDDLRCVMFRIVTLGHSNYIFVITLFFTLTTYYNIKPQVLSNDLEKYFKTLESQDFSNALDFLLKSFNDDNIIGTDLDKLDSCIVIISSFMSSLNKEILNNDPTLIHRSLSNISSNIETLTKSPALTVIINMIKKLLSDKNWAIDQYSIEIILSIVYKIAAICNKRATGEVDSYVQLTQIVSNILLFHRYRLSSRNHMIMSVHVVLMECLSMRGSLNRSKEAAYAYTRLLSNLCEPQASNNKIATNNLSSYSTKVKKTLRKHVHVLITSFIYISLKYNFSVEVMNELEKGIFKVFDVVSQVELNLVSAQLDTPGRTYYKTLYQSYKDHGKWKDE